MGKLKERLIDEERIKFERAESAYLALPEAQAETLVGVREILQSHMQLVAQNADLREQVVNLQSTFAEATGPLSRWRERGFGFLVGVAASVAASFIWVRVVKQWPMVG